MTTTRTTTSRHLRRGTSDPTIMVGFDGTSSSWDALCWASGEATRLRGRVVAVFVSPEWPDGMLAAVSAMSWASCTYPLFEVEQGRMAELLESEVRRYSTSQIVRIEFVHLRGDPVSELVELAQQTEADLIVVGRSKAVRHRVAGSVGRRLTSKQLAPVTVVVP